ncbi:hypothetical protein BASA60_003792 [Batrachochytrium salamandrivorans]|nr:hypothetical protein BASA60_003792 [Batrachochytrium salamandrivorans]
MERHTRIQEVLALLVIQTNPDIPQLLKHPTKEQTTNSPYYSRSSTSVLHDNKNETSNRFHDLLFAMMAAQAAVLSVAPATDVNLVKRAPNGDDDVEQSDMAGQSSFSPQLPKTPSRKKKKTK